MVRAPDSCLKVSGFESPQLSVFTLIHSTPVLPHMLPQSHGKDPSHSAKSADGRLQLNSYAPYLCIFK